jgi:hypothetical protein
MAAVGMAFLLSAAVNAVPPGTEDEIADRIKPYGVVARAESNAAPIVPEAVQPLTLAKVELSQGSEHVVEMLNMGEDGSMVFQPSVIKVSVGDTIRFKATMLEDKLSTARGQPCATVLHEP